MKLKLILKNRYQNKEQQKEYKLYPYRYKNPEPENIITLDIVGTSFYLDFAPYKNGNWRAIMKNIEGKWKPIARTITIQQMNKILIYFTKAEPIQPNTSLSQITKFAKKAL